MRTFLLTLTMSLLCLAQGPPRLVLDASKFDLGQVEPGAKAVHRFKVTNGGGAALHLTRTEASCGCTSSVVGKNTLEPGESTELEVTFASAGFRGKVEKSLVVYSDDPAAPRTSLFLEAEVMAPVRVPPDDVFFHDLRPRDRRKHSVKLESATASDLVVADAELSEAPWLGVATRTVGKDLFVDLDLVARKLPADQASGTDTITLHLLNPGPSVVTLKIRWEKRKPN